MIKVFYDSHCGLCSKEINHYRDIAPAERFAWLPIHENLDQLQAEQISEVAALKWLHVKTDNGELKKGVEGFICIWRAIPRYQLLAKLLALPGIHWLTKQAYFAFAAWHFKRLSHCQAAMKKT